MYCRSDHAAEGRPRAAPTNNAPFLSWTIHDGEDLLLLSERPGGEGLAYVQIAALKRSGYETDIVAGWVRTDHIDFTYVDTQLSQSQWVYSFLTDTTW